MDKVSDFVRFALRKEEREHHRVAAALSKVRVCCRPSRLLAYFWHQQLNIVVDFVDRFLQRKTTLMVTT